MPKDTQETLRPDELTAAELDRLAARLFCAGGPPERIDPELLARFAPRPGR